MSLELTTHDIDALVTEAEKIYPPVTSSDDLETIHTVPPILGRGYARVMDLCSGLELCIIDTVLHDVIECVSENEHLVQFAAYLSGVLDSWGYVDGDYLQIDAQQSYIGGSGIQPRHFARPRTSHRHVGVDIHVTPDLFEQFFANAQGELPVSLQSLVQGDNWQYRFSPKMTETMRTVVQQIINCPFLGIPKRLYLQGKVFELMALQLDSLSERTTAKPASTLKADTVNRIHYAAEILRSHLESPPNQTTLAQQVGMSDRTLQKGFKSVFGVTPFAYLTQQRMHQAEQLLRQPHRTVAEVANIVGYANPAQFAAAFKRQFGINPSDCLRGKKLIKNSLLG